MTELSEPTRARRYRPRPSMSLMIGAAIVTLLAAVMGAWASMPIYQTPWVWVLTIVTWALVFATVLFGRLLHWGVLTLAALVGVGVIAIVPLAVPSAFSGGFLGILGGYGDGLAAIALGWKQLLTLTLPVGTYQAVLVPLYVVVFVSTALAAWLALRGGRVAPFGAIPLLAPVTFGVLFGSSQLSEPVRFGPLTITAPRELAQWALVCVLGVGWVAWSSGIQRRAALRLGRETMVHSSDEQAQTSASGAHLLNRISRAAIAVVLVLVAGGIGLWTAPAIGGEREVPRDAVEPNLIVQQQTSPLASYRSEKKDDALDETMFTVSSDGALPGRLRLAVLDNYDGVDFFVGDDPSAGRFSRFPSGESVRETANVRVTIGEGYRGIWVPITEPLASTPTFGGSRAGDLADAFYVNRETWSAIAIPDGRGVREGDTYEARMSTAEDQQVSADPVSDQSLIDLDLYPELSKWLDAQELPSNAEGLVEAVTRLRDRGYLSHSITDGEGERLWLESLASEYGTKFFMSAGGHSRARIESLFLQLNEQALAAGEEPDERALIAGIGDDEQFATSAALIARAMGYESRVVLGVRLGDADAGVPGTPACAESCTGENLAAWIEVRGGDGAWAPLDASPQVETPPTELEKGEELPEFPTVPEERDAQVADPPAGSSGDDGEPSEAEDTEGALPIWDILRTIGLILLALVLLLLPILFVPMAKRLRRRQREGTEVPELFALGAWDELIDRASDNGRRADMGWTRADIADDLQVPGGEWIAWTVDRAVFSREGITAPEAAELWRYVDAAILATREGRGFWARLAGAFSIRTFMPRRRRSSRAWDRALSLVALRGDRTHV